MRATTVLLAAAVVAGAALRFLGLGDQSYWYDETVTVTVLDGSLGDVLDRLPDSESTPPLYYVLAWLWTQVAGLSEAGLRSFSAVAGLAAVPVVYLAARELAGRGAGVVAAALVAVNPMLVWYSQEARAYGLVTLLAALTLLATVRRRLVLWAVASTLLVLTHYFGVFLVAAEAALLLLAHRDRPRPVLLACAPWLVAGLALIPLARAQEEDGRTSWIADEPLPDRLADVARELGTANTSLISSSSAPPGGVLWIPALLALPAAGVAIALARRRAAPAAGVALAGAAAVLVPLALAVTPLDFFKDRNLIAAWPVLAVALAAELALSARRELAAVVTAVVAAAGIGVTVAVAT
ncbi:MAG: glycosyltransferase family 39 protein, partial [Actinomycetota bacterium]|nr:glycosyltransferase family 39 protein [Actinomycetota bacterium]